MTNEEFGRVFGQALEQMNTMAMLLLFGGQEGRDRVSAQMAHNRAIAEQRDREWRERCRGVSGPQHEESGE